MQEEYIFHWHKDGYFFSILIEYAIGGIKMPRILTLAEQINKRNWWHSPPVDKKAYKKRGMFLSSSFKEEEFYGRPEDQARKVTIKNPLIGTEREIIKQLFGEDSPQAKKSAEFEKWDRGDNVETSLEDRFALDQEMKEAAEAQGYDAIAIVTEKGLEKVRKCGLPRSVELNVLDIENGITKGLC